MHNGAVETWKGHQPNQKQSAKYHYTQLKTHYYFEINRLKAVSIKEIILYNNIMLRTSVSFHRRDKKCLPRMDTRKAACCKVKLPVAKAIVGSHRYGRMRPKELKK